LDKDTILSLQNVTTAFRLREGLLKAVDNVSFDVKRGEVIALVGESGCGKSITVKTILRLIRKPGYSSGKLWFRALDQNPVDLLTLEENGPRIRGIRGRYINMIFQEPLNALSPVHTIANQMIESIMLHSKLNKTEARELSIKLLGDVGIPQPEKRVDAYSFQLSGGMRQRALIAMAISTNPELLIADEPTTALDVSVQAQILRLLRDIQQKLNMSLIFITHDLAVVAQMVDRVYVMYLGQIVEDAPVEELFRNPRHPYTKKLLASILDPGDWRQTDAKINTISGSVPEPIDLPWQCNFCGRCDEFEARCADSVPDLTDIGENGIVHRVRCFKYNGGAAVPKHAEVV
jgi:oligopeptide/dipeptide ABC transporter ATP-binding protein